LIELYIIQKPEKLPTSTEN